MPTFVGPGAHLVGVDFASPAASKTVYRTGATTQPASILGIASPDCASGTSSGWDATSLVESCQARAGATPSASLNVSVSLPDCVTGGS